MNYLFKLTCSLAVMTMIGLGSAFADGKFDNAIKVRKALMSLYAWNLGQLGAMAKGEVDYDAEAAKTAA
ncbi:MAG: cytochrome c, partial [Roseibium sp.]